MCNEGINVAKHFYNPDLNLIYVSGVMLLYHSVLFNSLKYVGLMSAKGADQIFWFEPYCVCFRIAYIFQFFNTQWAILGSRGSNQLDI